MIRTEREYWSFVCGTVGAGESSTHRCPQGPGTSLAFTCIKIECPTQARMGRRGGEGVQWFQMTGALILLVTLLLFGTVYDPYFPKEGLFPSAVSALMQMFHKSEIVLMKKNAKSFTV